MPLYIRPDLKILIVDDDRIAVSFLKKFLSPLGKCEVALTGEDGLAAFRGALNDAPFDVVCLDIGLPDMSGKTVLTELRKEEKKAGIKKPEGSVIIMTTAAASMKDVLRAMELGCNGYVVKPFSREQLFSELNRAGLEIDWE